MCRREAAEIDRMHRFRHFRLLGITMDPVNGEVRAIRRGICLVALDSLQGRTLVCRVGEGRRPNGRVRNSKAVGLTDLCKSICNCQEWIEVV